MTRQQIFFVLSIIAFVILCIVGAGFLADQGTSPSPEFLWGTLGAGLALFAAGHI